MTFCIFVMRKKLLSFKNLTFRQSSNDIVHGDDENMTNDEIEKRTKKILKRISRTMGSLLKDYGNAGGDPASMNELSEYLDVCKMSFNVLADEILKQAEARLFVDNIESEIQEYMETETN